VQKGLSWLVYTTGTAVMLAVTGSVYCAEALRNRKHGAQHIERPIDRELELGSFNGDAL
jgi:hypothetical protein